MDNKLPEGVKFADITKLGMEPLHCPSCHQPTMALTPWLVSPSSNADWDVFDPFWHLGLAECFRCEAWFTVTHGLN